MRKEGLARKEGDSLYLELGLDVFKSKTLRDVMTAPELGKPPHLLQNFRLLNEGLLGMEADGVGNSTLKRLGFRQ